jgi:chromatin remodeling complex protein RSC6
MNYSVDNTSSVALSATETNPNQITIELPSTLSKIEKRMSELKDKLYRNKVEAAQLYNEVRSVEKLLERYIVNYTKQALISANSTNARAPSGFASPTKVSDALCDFMGKERGSLISRTEMSKFLFAYIREHKLQAPNRPSIILPDDALAKLLGEEAMLVELTHFTIQKYLTPHFFSARNS